MVVKDRGQSGRFVVDLIECLQSIYHSTPNSSLIPVVNLDFEKMVILTTCDHSHGQEWSI